MMDNILDLTYLLFCASSNEFVIFIETEKQKKSQLMIITRLKSSSCFVFSDLNWSLFLLKIN